MRVFLSYARSDGSTSVTCLHDELQRAGFSVWMDVAALEGTSAWREQLRTALRNTDALIVLMTPGAAASSYVMLEWEIAKALQKPVITALCLPAEIPEELRANQIRDLGSPAIYTRELLALIDDLRNVQEAARNAVRDALVLLREDNAFKNFHPAIERLQRWLNAGAYEPRIFWAVIGLLRQMKTDTGPERPVSSIIRESVEGTYIQSNWDCYALFQEQRRIFEYILTDLSKDIREVVPTNALRVPIVLAVMSAAESQQLIDGTAFERYREDLQEDFGALQEVLTANGVGNWHTRYGATPQDWRPFAGEATIAQLAQKTLQDIEAEVRLVPEFLDLRALGNESSRGALRRLRNDGCIVVMDSISMRHPDIQRAMQQSMLDAYSKTSLVNIAPLQSAFDMMRRMRIVLRLQTSDLEFHKRSTDNVEDYAGCREIHQPRELEQWLSDRVRKLFTPGANQKGIRSRAFEFPRRSK